MHNISLFAQIISKIPRKLSDKLITQHQSDKHSKGIGTWEHLVAMLFCQFGQARSLRDISHGLRAAQGNLSHLGVRQVCSRSNLSYLNAHRRWEYFRDLYHELAQHYATSLRGTGKLPAWFKRASQGKLYALDATTVSLCLKSFDWAHHRQQKGGVKLHSVLDMDTLLPEFVHMTEAIRYDSRAAHELFLPSGSVVVADRAYLDMALLEGWNRQGIRFVVRLKRSFCVELEQDLALPKDSDSSPTQRIVSDQLVRAMHADTRAKYPHQLRLVRIQDPKTGDHVDLLTNQLPQTDAWDGQTSWTAAHIGELYRLRWQIELFFRDIKQHLKIKSFVGTSENAVLIQIWTAMITLLLTRLLQIKADTTWCMANMLSFIRLHLFAKINLEEWLQLCFDKAHKKAKVLMPRIDLFST